MAGIIVLASMLAPIGAVLLASNSYSRRIDALAERLEHAMASPNYSTTITTGNPPMDILITATEGTQPEEYANDLAAWFKHLIDEARAKFPNEVGTGGGN